MSPEENLESAGDIYGFDGLNEADQQMLTEVRAPRSNTAYHCIVLTELHYQLQSTCYTSK